MVSSPATNLTEKLGQVHLLPPLPILPDSETEEERDFILSQELFCTPDYITPDEPQIKLDYNTEYNFCPKSPEKSKTSRIKRHRVESIPSDSIDTNLPCPVGVAEFWKENFGSEDSKTLKAPMTESQKKKHVSQSAVALRCRVMPPPCIKNPYAAQSFEMDVDTICPQRWRSAVVGGDGLSRYHTDFHELEEIGRGNFSRVFKVLKRIDGCMYAVKYSIRQLHNDTERREALMEVQALAALGFHPNLVSYYSSWFENEQLYIQMELCDGSLSIHNSSSALPYEGEIINVMRQIAQALQFIHERGIAHLDVKPDNIYVKNGIYKLGDFGQATLINGSLPIEEGDARYMPLEILNDKHDYLDKVDIFSLGASIYELVKGSPLPTSGSQFSMIREGKLSLLPGYSLQFQNLLKMLMDPDPVKRPSAKELLENAIFKNHSSTRCK
ncbi:wee1-like protein kinase isoform X2 [Amborella trichopoda]|uniref:wee1-like protein kinase isoform X2 n=1 Tax=Amborella trichopoda TaxID=13333 RepID=UPI0009BE0F2C|nr:wee1-like protein kinase isoform X2 [Amborella trichopoda]|eukprot:XP_020526066.1 wee1-like protein kinase isoform X2 [Amborella trichopoda]